MFDHFFMSFKVEEKKGEEPLTNIRFNDHFFFQTRCLFIRYVQTEQKTLLPISIVRKRFFSIQDFIVMLNFDFILLLYSFHDFIYSRYLTSVYFSESNSIYEKKTH